MIPKRIHMCYHWEAPPEWVLASVDEFAAMNPDYEMIFWDHIPKNMPTAIHEALTLAPTCRFKSDLVRYWLLQQHGGIYVDVDCRPVKPFDDDLLEHDAFCARYGDYNGNHCSADNFFMGCVANHHAIKAAIARCFSPSAWSEPKRYFGTINVLMDNNLDATAGLDLLDWHAVRACFFDSEQQELLTLPRVPLAQGPEYVKHYEAHGCGDIDMSTEHMRIQRALAKCKRPKREAKRLEAMKRDGVI